MDDRCLRPYTRNPRSCQLLFEGRAAGVIMAVPFVLCFTLFGVFNLVGGTVLTIMACRPKISKQGLEIIRQILKNSEFQFEQQLDPMQVVGIILLLTGCLLVAIGISLGVVACRSVSEEKRHRRRKGIEEASMSGGGLAMSTMAERSQSRRTSSLTFSPYMPGRKSVSDCGSRKKSLQSDNVVSPILEEVDPEWENGKSSFCDVEDDQTSTAELRSVSFGQFSSSLKSREISFKVTWASDVACSGGDSSAKTMKVLAEVEQASAADEPRKIMLTTDL